MKRKTYPKFRTSSFESTPNICTLLCLFLIVLHTFPVQISLSPAFLPYFSCWIRWFGGHSELLDEKEQFELRKRSGSTERTQLIGRNEKRSLEQLSSFPSGLFAVTVLTEIMSLPPNYFHNFPGMTPLMPMPGQFPMGKQTKFAVILGRINLCLQEV